MSELDLPLKKSKVKLESSVEQTSLCMDTRYWIQNLSVIVKWDFEKKMYFGKFGDVTITSQMHFRLPTYEIYTKLVQQYQS